MRLKLTDLTIQNLKHQHPQVTYWDTLLPAFGVRVGARSKTFIVMQGKTRKRQTIGKYPAISLQDARSEARLRIDGASPASRDATAHAIAQEYLRSITVRPRTAYEYDRLLSKYLPHKPLARITSKDILHITDGLLQKPTECRHTHVALQTFFNWCVPRYLSTSPMLGLKPPTRPKHRDRILTLEELRKVWHTDCQPVRSVIRISILTALRRSEAKAITPEWIDGDTLVVPAHITKNGREHRLPISSTLRPHLLATPIANFNWSIAKTKHDRLSGVSGYVLHDLRRTAASIMAAPPISAPPHLIERILNHITGSGTVLQHTYQRYTYATEIKEIFEKYHAHLEHNVIWSQ